MGLAAMMANIMSQDKIFAGDKQRSGMAFRRCGLGNRRLLSVQ